MVISIKWHAQEQTALHPSGHELKLSAEGIPINN